MRHLLNFTILSLLISNLALAQDLEDQPTTVDTTLNDKVDRLTEAVEKLAEKIKSDTLVSSNVGEITLYKTDGIQTYTCVNCKREKKPTSTKISISKVVIEVREGVIHDIQVFTNDGRIFSNDAAPIELNRLNERCDLLNSSFFDGQNTYRIQTCDFLQFERMGGFTSNDIRIVLTKDDNKRMLTKEVGINSIFNIRLYTDLLGAFGDEPNGLVQTDVDFKTPLLSTNMFNSNTQWLNYFTFRLNLSKLDNDFQYTRIDSTFKRIDFYQHSWLTSEVGFNIISGNLGNKSNNRWAADLVGGVSLSNAIDESDTSTVVLPYVGFNPSLSIRVARNIFISLSSKLIYQYAPEFSDSPYGGRIRIIKPEFELSWNPLGSPGNKIFGRVRYVQQFHDDSPFFQLQLGYNLSLSEIINKKLESK
jgi:hypothetical protein